MKDIRFRVPDLGAPALMLMLGPRIILLKTCQFFFQTLPSKKRIALKFHTSCINLALTCLRFLIAVPSVIESNVGMAQDMGAKLQLPVLQLPALDKPWSRETRKH